MDLRQLKYFCAVVDQGSFHKAADALNISPPALSLSIKKLETELAVTLLERKPGGILPTSFGNCLYESAQQIQANVESAVDQLNRIRGIGNGRVNVGLLPYGIPSAMGELIGRFCDRYPGLRVQTALGSYGYLVGRLNDGELDFMVSESSAPAGNRRIVHEPLFRLRYGLVVGQKHPLAGRRNLSLARVMDYRLAYASTWRVVLDNWDETFAAAGLAPPPQPMGEATDDFLRAMLANCNMVAVLPMIGTIKDAIEAGQLAELHVPKVEWYSTVALVYRSDEALAPDAKLLLEETRRELSVPLN
jgi:LysR family transcriptional regulator, regulator for genes of the gallate degradation pathway